MTASMKITARAEFKQTPKTKEWYGEIYMSTGKTHRTRRLASKKKALEIFNVMIRNVNRIYNKNLAEKLKPYRQTELMTNGIIAKRFAPNPHWDNTCRHIPPEQYQTQQQLWERKNVRV